MRLRARRWVVVGLLCCVGGISLWRFAVRREAGDEQKQVDATSRSTSGGPRAQPSKPKPLLIQTAFRPGAPENAAVTTAANTNGLLRYRLSNTAKGVDELTRDD